jgi:hypothetical protein
VTQYSHFQLLDENAVPDEHLDLLKNLRVIAPYVIVPGGVYETASPEGALQQAARETAGGTVYYPHVQFPQIVIPKSHIHVLDGSERREVDWSERSD